MLCKSRLVILFSLALFCALQTYAQDSCYNCNLDSLDAKLKTAKTDDEKIKLLTLLTDIGLRNLNGFSDSAETRHIRSLIELSKSQKVKDVDAYKNLQAGIDFFSKNDFKNAQDAFKKAISLFDQTQKKIPNLLFITRNTYNQIGNQEDRYKFYTDKLHQYLVNGPIENVASCYHCLAGYYLYKADYNLAISDYLKAIDLYKNFYSWGYRNTIGVVANTYAQWGNYEKAIEYFNISLPLIKAEQDTLGIPQEYNNISSMYLALSDYSKALAYADSGLLLSSYKLPPIVAQSYLAKASALIGLNQISEVLNDLTNAKRIQDSGKYKIFASYGALETDYTYYQYYSAIKKFDEAGQSLLTAYQKAVDVKSNSLQLKYLKELSLFYGQHNQPQLAFTYTKKFYELTDSLDRDHSAFKVAQYENEKKELQQNDSLNVLKQQSAVQSAVIRKNNMMLWGSLIAIVLISVSMFFVYRQYHLNKKTLSSLRKTQRQLITAEKMASLGELTAGIAHEIQNPLNFVNNFSEVSNELLDEMKDGLDKGDMNEAKAIANDVKQNLEKIIHHGKRADAIVKSMLQHSRSSSGQKELTDINVLADEYLRLSYHGLRAKDKTFNAAFTTDYDASIDKLNIVPQDIGRVLLNLFTNAFYSVSHKNRDLNGQYEPMISVCTKKLNGKIEIHVKDNGSGIPQTVLDKIFQPFFTTKPTGEGTGLGLSLSYDIIKAHGGEIKVETKDGEGAEFIIALPIEKREA